MNGYAIPRDGNELLRDIYASPKDTGLASEIAKERDKLAADKERSKECINWALDGLV